MTNPRICVVDTETDPFKHKRDPKPFCVGFYDGDAFVSFWGQNCIADFVSYISDIEEPMIIYAHNGGRFDFLFMLQYISQDIFVIGSRIVKGYIGRHEIRDSYAIFPEPLKAYEKDDFEYEKMEEDVREDYKHEILKYLKNDCIFLYDIVIGFRNEFGDKLTIGSASMTEFRKFYPFPKMQEHDDIIIRNWYMGGRNQCFKSGLIKGSYTILDVNSMYPAVMKNSCHPFSSKYSVGNQITSKTMFAKIYGRNCGTIGALPFRTKQGIDFTVECGEFFATIHELNMAVDLGLFKIDKVILTLDFQEVKTFDTFIDHFIDKKIKAEKQGNKLLRSFYKRVPNSTYGKCGQNPLDFMEHALTTDMLLDPSEGWMLSYSTGNHYFWERPSPKVMGGFYHVGIAASVTGASRAVLLNGLHQSTDPIYCDTDSIIARSHGNLEIHDTKLGAWKSEGRADFIAIAGKKLYAAFLEGKCIKQASKGARLSHTQILEAARGGVINYMRDAPSIDLTGHMEYVARDIKKTVDKNVPWEYDPDYEFVE